MTYEVLNAATTNTIASYDNEAEARAGLQRLAHAHPEWASELALVAFDDEGEATELLSAPAIRQYA